MEMNRLTRDGTAEPVSRDQILRRERGQGNIDFPCSADHEQDWQPYPVDPHTLATCATIHTYTHCRSFLHAHFIPIVSWVWEREANINWSMVTFQGSTRSELP